MIQEKPARGVNGKLVVRNNKFYFERKTNGVAQLYRLRVADLNITLFDNNKSMIEYDQPQDDGVTGEIRTKTMGY